LRVDIEEFDSLLRSVTEASVHLGTLRKDIDASEGANDLDVSRLLADVDRVGGELAEIREATRRLRLFPAHSMFPSLDRAVRDAAEALGTRVELQTSGGDIRLDAHVLGAVRDSLTQIVRNAVTHGIESQAERRAAGKAAVGRVQVHVERRGSHVRFVCSDDGRGIDVEAVRRAAVATGRVGESVAQSMSPEQVISLLSTSKRGNERAGLTTSRNLTELSGRGIGLDIVRATASRLKGDMSIRSEAGRGATIEIQVPISVASLQGLIVECAGSISAIPLDCVRRTLRVTDSDVARAADRDSILDDGRSIPFFALHRALDRTSIETRGARSWSAIIVEDDNRRVAVGVDSLRGTSTIVMQTLPALVGADAIISGASLDAEGNPLLVLDPAGLVAAAERGRGVLVRDAGATRAPILVIDDSLTTRMLEQSILESAGYEVEVATSAEEALAKAQGRRYCLFIVDVEMPGMDGFEFVTMTRANPSLRDIPAILVTSRNAPEDRRRGEQAGAAAYIIKSEFDQNRLLQTIRLLIE
jgi:two-component system chemotaxis sensor kinase CheA